MKTLLHKTHARAVPRGRFQWHLPGVTVNRRAHIYVYIYVCGWIGYKKVVILAGGLTIQNEL